jgi:ergothioneine biosynthesis protein EgtB
VSKRPPDTLAREIGDRRPVVQDLGLGREALLECYQRVRDTTEALCAPLETEDYLIQSMPDASPAKWHLAHTSWFFETFIVSGENGFTPVDERYSYLFNSYYNAVGERIARDRRGLLSRPTVAEVYEYRKAVDKRVRDLLDRADSQTLDRVRGLVILGLNHEQQHQELILTDLKHALGSNPLRPVYRERQDPRPDPAVDTQVTWTTYSAGLRSIGHDRAGFAFDNEGPRHQQYVAAFALANRLATNREYNAFMEDGGYDRPECWLSDGWFARSKNAWRAPLYWEQGDGGWQVFTLAGMRDVALDEPVCHVSYYEADAFARWAGCRLATEAEWETAAGHEHVELGMNFLESSRFHPAPIASGGTPESRCSPAQLFGDVWEWTASPYVAYPGFRPAAGALGEYNGKFMCNQFVLRGGSCATPKSHIRATYRNFFPPEARWQFSGIRLAKDPC